MAKLHDPSSAKLGFSRRQFLAGAAAGAGVLGGFLEDFSFGPGPHCEVLGASSLRGSPVHKGLGHLQRQQLRSAYRAQWLATVPDQYRYIPRF
jgi:hypothetical protein